ncbi:hypothetical protein GCM10028807_43500 [Spirosoma daeguense]
MGQDYDKIIKENIEGILLPLARKVLALPEPEGLIEIPDDLQYTIERKPDFLKMVTNAAGDGLFVLQLEFQTRDEPDMLSRMLFYAAQLYGKYKLPIKQYVFYIGSRPARMRRELEQEDLLFRFHVRNVVDVPYSDFLNTDKPEEMVLAILGNMGNEPPVKVVQQILNAIKAIEPSQLALGKFFRQIEVLSKLRNIQSVVIEQFEAMAIVYDLETDIRYLQGKQKGAEEALLRGVQEGLKEGLKEGRQVGIQEGRQVGIQEGRQVGIQEGRQVGIQEGRQVGMQETQREAVKGLLRLGVLTIEQIATALDVTTDFVLTIQRGIDTSASNK